MILEAFAKYLHAADPKIPATDVLAQWLWRHLSTPPTTNVDKVLHCEMTIREIKSSKREMQEGDNSGQGKGQNSGSTFNQTPGQSSRPNSQQNLNPGSNQQSEQNSRPSEKPQKTSYVFCGTSSSGRRLLKSLYEYCQSYEQQRFARFIHTIKASDFSEELLGR